MSFTKRNYKDGDTIITAKNLNDIQDAIQQNADDITSNKTAAEQSMAKYQEDTEDLFLGCGVNFDYDKENNLLYLVNADGDRIGDPVSVSGGGGGGGGGSGGNSAVMTATNTSGWINKTVSEGAECEVTITWSSIENEMPTGDGSMSIYVNNVLKRSVGVSQGELKIDLGPYLSSGRNRVRVVLSDVYGNQRTLIFTVNEEVLTISSYFDTSGTFNADETIPFAYIPVGILEKTVHFVVDGESVGEQVVTTSNVQQTYMIPGMSHGEHKLNVYFTAEIDGEEVSSNTLSYSLIVVDEESTTPIISSMFNTTTAPQYSTLSIAYRVYTPNSLTSDIEIYANNEKISEQTVDRTEQVWTYRLDNLGLVTLSIASGNVVKIFEINVTDSGMNIGAVTEDLVLYLNATGRSNSEQNPGTWVDEDNNISAVMTGFNFVSDGWQVDEDGYTALRVGGDARVEIPYKPFQNDFRGAGKTIEIEFATRDILNYDSVIISCWSGGRGFQFTAQKAVLASEQSEISTQYKEDEHVRISFVAEKRAENRLLEVYINGIMSGVVQYADNDDFSQQTPVTISIGSSYCTTDIYCIRMYDNDLTRQQILGNWIADTQDIGDMINRYERNNIYDDYGQVVIEKLPTYLPYFILDAAELPQYKGDKKTITGTYVDPSNPEKSFTFRGCQINVQGTSSAPYYRKNYDMQFKSGFEMTKSKEHASNFALDASVVPFNRFVLKADVASSEGANNVELVMLYCDLTPFKKSEADEDARIREGIFGFPIVVFWHDTVHNTTTFLGKYNFNLPKRAPEPYGYSGDMESWEFQNNTSDLMNFKTDYFDETMYTDPTTQETKELWRYDYEARFPSDEWVNYRKLQEFQSFIYSTYRENATGDDLDTPVTYEGTIYEKDTAAYRLAKFRAEFGNYAEVNSFLFYYIFTEFFLMVDSRAKNLFIGFSGSPTDPELGLAIDRKAVAEPYDMDTAIGTNNEGSLVFGYAYEDTDHLPGGADIFNGQESVLWCNIRDAFKVEYTALYQQLRSAGTLSFDVVEKRFEDHQKKWSEAIFNEDAWIKYIVPLVSPDSGKKPTDVYLPMLQGSKAEQRKWWLYNRFPYYDSKLNAGDALSDVIQLRAYDRGDITVTPYADIYPTVKYASYVVSERGARGVPTTLVCPSALPTFNDTEIYIYSASKLAAVSDLSPLMVGFSDFSMATKIQVIKIGDADPEYENTRLSGLTLGNNVLLNSLDVRNCSGLGDTTQQGHTQTTVDLSGCTNIEYVYFGGTKVTSVSLPNGGILKTLQLPNTITNLTVRNQSSLTSFTVDNDDYSNITTLRVENSGSAIPVLDILDALPENSRVRLLGFTTVAETTDDVEEFFDYLDTMRGLDENGNTVDKAVVSGTINGLDTITGAWLAEMKRRYPNVTITYNHISSILTYYNYDGSQLLYTEEVKDGGNGSYTGTPTRSDTAQYTYAFIGWNKEKNQTSSDNSAADANATKAVAEDRKIYAAYRTTVRTYTVRYMNGTTVLQTYNNVPYGSSVSYTGTAPVHPDVPEDYEFIGWSPDGTEITGATDCQPVWKFIGIVTYKILNGTLSGNYENSLVTKVKRYAFSAFSVWSYWSSSATAMGVSTMGDKLTGISFPNCEEIGAGAFNGNRNLKNVYMPKLTSIGENAFYWCTSLSTLVTSKLTYIGSSAFANTRIDKSTIDLTELTYCGDSVFSYAMFVNFDAPELSYIGSHCFDYNLSLISVSLPKVNTLGSYAFRTCTSLETVYAPSCTQAGAGAFYGCLALENIDLPLLNTLDSSIFLSCTNLTTANFPSARYINASAFRQCYKLRTISLPLVTTIGMWAFSECNALSYLSLPHIQYIHSGTFISCNNLRTLIIGTERSECVSLWNSAAFSQQTNLTIYVPDSLVTSYQTSTNWAVYSSIIKGISELDE